MKTYGITTMSGFASNFVAHLIMEHEEFLKYSDHTIINDGVNIMHGMVNRYNPIPKDIAVEAYRSSEMKLAHRIKLINELDTVAQHSSTVEEYLDNFYPGSNYTADSNIIAYIGPEPEHVVVKLHLDAYRDLGIHLVIIGATHKEHIDAIMARRLTINHTTHEYSTGEYENKLTDFIADVKATDGLEWSFINVGKLVIDGSEEEYTKMCAALGITPNVALFNEKLAWYKANVWDV